MAASNNIASDYINANLRSLWTEFDGIPATAEDWPNYDDEDRFEFALEWPDTMSRFQTLARAEMSGKLNDDQQTLFERLVHRYAEVVPIIERLGLETIPIPAILSRR